MRDGRWVVTLQLDGKRRSFYGPTAAAARAAASTAIGEYQAGVSLDAARMTLSEWLDRWLEQHVRLKRRPNTYRSYEQSVRVHIAPAIGRVRLARLHPQHIEVLLHAMVAKGLGPRTIGRVQSVLGSALQHAVRQQVLARNVAWMVEPVPARRDEVEHLRRDQIRRVLGSALGEPNGALYVVVLALGLRQGEALGLRWYDPQHPGLGGVDLEAGLVHVRVQLQRGQLVDLKRPRSRRVLELSPWLVDVLQRHAGHLRELRQLAGGKWQEHGLVFPSRVGTPQRAANAHLAWKRWLRRHGLDDIKFHALRHTAATLMIEARIDLFKVSRTLGHTSIRTTADIYGHLTDEGRHEVAERMHAALLTVAAGRTGVRIAGRAPGWGRICVGKGDAGGAWRGVSQILF